MRFFRKAKGFSRLERTRNKIKGQNECLQYGREDTQEQDIDGMENSMRMELIRGYKPRGKETLED